MRSFEVDGRRGGLAESDDILRLVAASADGRMETYAYRGYRFTIERKGLTWWCHEGAGRRGDLIALRHEAGWASCSKRSIIRKLRRAIDRRLRREGRRAETGT